MNRVTDVAIPEEEAIRHIEKPLLELWKDAAAAGDRRFPHEYLYDILLHSELEFEGNPENSWLVAAADANIPIFVPGWEDSTLGNILTARVIDCTFKNPDIIKGGLYAMQSLADWYREDDSPTGILIKISYQHLEVRFVIYFLRILFHNIFSLSINFFQLLFTNLHWTKDLLSKFAKIMEHK